MAIFGDSAGLLFRIQADSSQASTEIKKILGEVSGMSSGTVEAMEKILGPAAAVAAGFAGIGIAAAGVTKILFDMADAASEYGSKIHDAAQQTGITTDSVQALKFAAEQSGSSFEAVTGAVAKFSELLGEAKNGNEKANATLKQYGVTSRDTDVALQQAIKTIASMTDHDQQAAAAKALFRDRTAAILPLIQSFDGDLPKLIQKLRDLGVIMGHDATNAADEFGDQMDTLKTQLSGVWRTLGTDLMPVFTAWANELSNWLKSNPGEIKAWGNTFVTVLQAIGNAVQILVTDLQILDEWSSNLINTPKYYQLLDRLAILEQKDKNFWAGKNILPGTNVNNQVDELTTQIDPSKVQTQGTGANADAEKAAEDRKQAREKAFQEEMAARSKQNQLLLKQEHEAFTADIDQWEKEFLAGERTKDSFRDASINRAVTFAQKAQALLDKQYKADLKGKAGTEKENVTLEYQNASAAVNKEKEKAIADTEKAITSTVKKENAERLRSDEETARNKLALQQEISSTRLKQLEVELKQGLINEHEYIAAIYAERVSVIESEKAVETSMDRRRILEEKIKQLRQDEALAVIDLSDKEKKAHEDRVKRWNEYVEQRIKDDAEEEARQKEAAENAAADMRKQMEALSVLQGNGVGQGIGQALGVHLVSIFGDQNVIKSQADFIKGVYADVASFAGNAIGSMVDGLSQLVTQWIVTGKFSAKAALQMAANIALGLALQAGVKAIFELAEGWAAAAAAAAMWWNPAAAAAYSASAAMHFAAAGIYGTVAGVAGAVGVGLALGARALGDKQTGNTASSSSSSGKNTSTDNQGQFYSSSPDATIEDGRTQPGRGGLLGTIDLNLHVQSNDTHIVKVVRKNMSLNGALRTEVAG